AALLPDGFRHNEQSLRIVELLENGGRGLNLTAETRDGILKHSKVRESVAAEAWGFASTLEGQIVKLADSLAYLNHDIEDAIRAGLIVESDLPGVVHRILGETHSDRIGTLVADVVATSAVTFPTAYPAATRGEGEPRIVLSSDALEATDALREFMFTRVYLHQDTLQETRLGQQIVEALFRHYEARPEEIPGFALPDDPPWRRAADYVAGMTDGYAARRASGLGLL
ncbi:MAG: deoxyguanosinetriphosphate triphosphohydrolase, partial [Chloroflexi bacterium]|nr:deoxyguanosinetriphosphate triphosphohydrolase [Chloroflexota bacterium]